MNLESGHQVSWVLQVSQDLPTAVLCRSARVSALRFGAVVDCTEALKLDPTNMASCRTVTKGRESFDDGRKAWFARKQDRSRILSLLAGWIARLDASIVDPGPVEACLRCAESTYI